MKLKQFKTTASELAWQARSSREINVGEFHGELRSDGSIIGFDYASQCWYDSSRHTPRNGKCQRGSAVNPIQELPVEIRLAAAPLGWDHV